MISDEALMAYRYGQADTRQAREIDAALAADPALRARLEQLDIADAALREAFDALLEEPVPERLTAAVRAGRTADAGKVVPLRPRWRPAPPAGPFGRAAGALAQAWRSSPPWLGLAAAGQAGLILLAALLLRGPLQPQDAAKAQYMALGARGAPAPANLMVMFRPETPERDLRAALQAADARIVGGPTTADAYLLYAPPAKRGAAVAVLKGRAEVTLAEPIDAPEAPR